jgi:dienelactone hydrolase
MKAPHPTCPTGLPHVPHANPASRQWLARVRQAGRVIQFAVQWTFRLGWIACVAWLAWAAVASALPGAGSAWAQRFEVAPANTLLAGEPVQIRLSGLPAGAEVQLHSERQATGWTGALQVLAAQARFQVGADGRLDLATARPLPGSSWEGADLRGLFWSMRPVATPAAGADTPAPPRHAVLLRVEYEGRELARTTLRLLPALPTVQQRPAEPLPGAVFAVLPAPAGGAPLKRPALILLGGSEGGTRITFDAPVYVSRGYAVLALPYYSPATWGPNGPGPAEVPALPRAFADIPLERLQQARDWLAAQPEVDATRIGVVGTSKGAEFALLAGVRMPWLRAVAALVPSDVVWEGWGEGTAPGQVSSFSWQGQPLPFVPYRGMAEEFAKFATGGPVRLRVPQDAGRAAHPERVEAARIPVERIGAPVFLAGGHDDQVWDSGGMAEAIARRRAAAGLPTVALVFPDAGHFLGSHGWGPTTGYNDGPSKVGGTPAANARAQVQVWAGLFTFLADALGPVPPVDMRAALATAEAR